MEIIEITISIQGGEVQREALSTHTPGLALVPVSSQHGGEWVSLTHQPSGRRLIMFDTLRQAATCAAALSAWGDWTVDEAHLLDQLGMTEQVWKERMKVAALNHGGRRENSDG